MGQFVAEEALISAPIARVVVMRKAIDQKRSEHFIAAATYLPKQLNYKLVLFSGSEAILVFILSLVLYGVARCRGAVVGYGKTWFDERSYHEGIIKEEFFNAAQLMICRPHQTSLPPANPPAATPALILSRLYHAKPPAAFHI
ncbi:hypothetical protein BKA66DRAFT_554406 [Pyrenochaeta sp. MPI-SDFR-AT-0127]|nr:hypothetical protein BKA66DRAFT_554406 [Pyrenochaeta sp. MPI-SDFR-AT-0127]